MTQSDLWQGGVHLSVRNLARLFLVSWGPDSMQGRDSWAHRDRHSDPRHFSGICSFCGQGLNNILRSL